MVIVSQTLSHLTLSNRHYDYDIFNWQINLHLDIKSLVSNNAIMVWVSNHQFLSLVHHIVYQNQLLNVPQWKLTSDTLTFLVELSSAVCCKSVFSKIRGYHRSMPMDMVFTFPGNYWIGVRNTINKSISISL